MKVLLIIPAYNEALNIEKTVKDVKENTNYDYVVINDCSKDNTKEVCIKNGFNMISLPVNYGLTSGIQVGMKYAMQNNYNEIYLMGHSLGCTKTIYTYNKLLEETEQGVYMTANIIYFFIERNIYVII